MSLKAVEMQVAIPRTTEAGAQQNQLTHKPVQDQAMLAGQLAKQADEARKKSVKIDETEQQPIRDEGETGGKGRRGAYKSRAKGQAEGEPDAPAHPYKGKHIDFSV